jgi:translocation and assembly module TamA
MLLSVRTCTEGWFVFAACALSCAGCASLPKDEYGVNRIEWKGVEVMDSRAIEACLATKKRDRISIQLGLGSASCGVPPFDSNTPELTLWPWPWSEWPEYDPAMFDVDRRRIERWYQARGFYAAKVTGVRYTAGGEQVTSPDQCKRGDCALTIRIAVDEGEPVRVRSVALNPSRVLPIRLLERLHDAIELRVGERFDEATYDADMRRLVGVLEQHAYAQAHANGRIAIDRTERTVDVRYDVDTGPASVYGDVSVEGNHEVSAQAIVDVAHLKRGDPYEKSELTDAERAVYALGVFAAVKIEARPRDKSNVVDLVIHVSPAATQTWRVGVGVMSGTMQNGLSDETVAVPEWDVHLRAAYTNQNFLGGMRKLRVEERPRLIMLDSFPGIPDGSPKIGNTLTVNFEQPRFPERRTVLFSDNAWDIGPDPYLGFFRDDIDDRVGLRRKFLEQKLLVQAAIEHDYYYIFQSETPPPTASSYELPFLEELVQLDLRNDAHRASRGLYLATTLQEALRLAGYGSWRYLRLLAEARAYQKLFWNIVLAERFAIGALFVSWADPDLDPTSQELGPQKYRLRGGGANSNRGFAAGTLGDGIDGGTRRWEGTVELRIPLSTNFSMVPFFDTGDVSRETHFRWSHVNASVGLGFRFYTPFAPIRLDGGWRIPGLQTLGGETEMPFKTRVRPNAAFLTIGEAF